MLSKFLYLLPLLFIVHRPLQAIELRSLGQEVSLEETAHTRFSPDNTFSLGELVISYDDEGVPRYAEIGQEQRVATPSEIMYQLYVKDEKGAQYVKFVATSEIGKLSK